MRNFSALVFLICFSACAQTPRHTNTLLFTTNTVGGLKVGVDEKQIPEILIGYSRFEGVFMPLVANTTENADGHQIPCPIAETGGSQGLIPPDCLLKGENKEGDKDAYSVLATFSGSATGKKGSDKSASASGAVAQYFATGLAARELALHAGAAAIATGDAAAASAQNAQLNTLLNDPNTLQVAQALQEQKTRNIALIGETFDQIPGETDAEKIAWIEDGYLKAGSLKGRGILDKAGFLNWLNGSGGTYAGKIAQGIAALP